MVFNLENQFFNPGDVVMEIGNPSLYLFDCWVQDTDRPRIREGQKARISLSAFPSGEYRMLEGAVQRVAQKPHDEKTSMEKTETTAELGNKYKVLITIEKPYEFTHQNKVYKVSTGLAGSASIVTDKDKIWKYIQKKFMRVKGQVLSDDIRFSD